MTNYKIVIILDFEGISTSIEETTLYLQEKIKPYKYIYFLGVSAGGYAAILFGSLLNITSVIAFIPQTFRRKKSSFSNFINPNYSNLKPIINSITKYYLYADSDSSISAYDPHHMTHCTRLSKYKNVNVIIKTKLSLPQMRNSGELFEIINNVIISK